MDTRIHRSKAVRIEGSPMTSARWRSLSISLRSASLARAAEAAFTALQECAEALLTSAGEVTGRSRSEGRRNHEDDGPVLWRVEQGLTLRLWRDSSHVSPRLLALRYRDAPGGQDARDLVPLRDGDAENEADGADDVRNCFYSGDVVGEPGSKAVVSLCHGMVARVTCLSRKSSEGGPGFGVRAPPIRHRYRVRFVSRMLAYGDVSPLPGDTHVPLFF
ncbi:hypothetical protein HPB52_008636 [Rhipicephalus sanguineus]|uniref:Peptidase M12B propeptide domain-containing protein n=1 Tax=Rhipicephalus sanguineus TaxID=34632 RepID=A0A9D4QE34_RHISA|nr:hypothetical protein HPB52_008636 [Rhipicephalus sanguineus]